MSTSCIIILYSISRLDTIPPEIMQTYEEHKIYQDLSVDDFKELIVNDETRAKISKVLEEYEIMKYETGIVPSTITVKQMQEILEEDEELDKFFRYLTIREVRRFSTKASIKRKREARSSTYVGRECAIEFDQTTGRPFYGLWKNAIQMRVNMKKEHYVHLPRLIASSFFGQKLVIDFDYDECMRRREAKNCAFQVSYGWNHIRKMDEPFDVWFCNLKEGSKVENYLNLTMEDAKGSEFPWKFKRRQESYLDIFPPEKLVYLSPDGKDELKEFDHEAVYIVGGFVDRSSIKPLSLAKCKREKIKCVRFPVDDYLFFKGTKVLTIDQAIGILTVLKEGKSMEEALKRFVPSRKLKTQEQIDEERAIRFQKLHGRRPPPRPIEPHDLFPEMKR
ncbi:tRNA methyltransferase 10 homolog C-like isoform X2 [Brevipalpus obovatus]|uniref:tRNA methyltransferase 10 homolog C-like isoform X2 n=1 Tax=Brevipalpus obovatus TaxID=246614 RepID=UPI003D9EFB22